MQQSYVYLQWWYQWCSKHFQTMPVLIMSTAAAETPRILESPQRLTLRGPTGPTGLSSEATDRTLCRDGRRCLDGTGWWEHRCHPSMVIQVWFINHTWMVDAINIINGNINHGLWIMDVYGSPSGWINNDLNQRPKTIDDGECKVNYPFYGLNSG